MDDEPVTQELYLTVGEPCIVAYELRGREAAQTALCELAAADVWGDDDLTVEMPILAPPRFCDRQHEALRTLTAELAELAPELFAS